MTATSPIVLLRADADACEAWGSSLTAAQTLARDLKKKRCRGVIVSGWDDRIPAFGARLRQVRLVVAVELAPRTIIARLDDLREAGPVLVLVAPPTTPADGSDVLAMIAALARTRLPTLRIAWTRAVPCWMHGSQPDIGVQVIPSLAPAGGLEPPGWHPTCGQCGARVRCDGPGKSPVSRPLPAPISNQFDVVRVEEPDGGGALDGSGALDSTGAPDSSADGIPLLVDQGDGERTFVGRNAHFGRAAIEHAMALGQLYLDVSDRGRLDDFAAQTRLLRADVQGTWRIVPGDAFAAAERALQAHLDRLTGLVIDVGAGPVRYVGRLTEAMASGRLIYLAVEPDAHHVAQASAAMPAGQFVRGVGEALPVPDGVADAVLMLRSWNHLRDPDAAVAEALRVLRPGGVLIAVDNVLFGLCRTTEQLRRAHAIAVSETPFEHLRNDNGDAAAERIAAGGFAIEVLEPVTTGTANQWLVRARKAR